MGERQSLRAVDVGRTAEAALASRKQSAIELIRRHERTLRRTARRYSLCSDDAEDALQRALEILMTKAPTSDQAELIRWMQTVTKHEALAVRRQRERNLARPLSVRDGEDDWVQLLPSEKDGPADAAERSERIATAREALKALKPQELRALTLLAEGYSYAEIQTLTGWTYTKVNRCLAEGRQRFRALFGSIEEGRRCEELSPALSAFVDGEADARRTAEVQAHLKECSHCRWKVRDFRAAPRAAAALLPALPLGRSVTDRAHELLAAIQARIPGRTGAAESAAGQLAAAGGTKGTGMAVAAKILTACVGTAGGAAACVATGVVPSVNVGAGDNGRPAVEQVAADPALGAGLSEATAPEPAPAPPTAPESVPPMPSEESAPAEAPEAAPEVTAEFSPEPTLSPPVAQSSGVGSEFGSPSSGGGAGVANAASGSAGEFGP
jgi:RNA polymerase sigma factor (sigma-70 family)